MDQDNFFSNNDMHGKWLIKTFSFIFFQQNKISCFNSIYDKIYIYFIVQFTLYFFICVYKHKFLCKIFNHTLAQNRRSSYLVQWFSLTKWKNSKSYFYGYRMIDQKRGYHLNIKKRLFDKIYTEKMYCT